MADHFGTVEWRISTHVPASPFQSLQTYSKSWQQLWETEVAFLMVVPVWSWCWLSTVHCNPFPARHCTWEGQREGLGASQKAVWPSTGWLCGGAGCQQHSTSELKNHEIGVHLIMFFIFLFFLICSKPQGWNPVSASIISWGAHACHLAKIVADHISPPFPKSLVVGAAHFSQSSSCPWHCPDQMIVLVGSAILKERKRKERTWTWEFFLSSWHCERLCWKSQTC